MIRLNVLTCVLVPVLYFGLQAAFAQYYPGYSFWTTTASDLGDAASPVGREFSAWVIGLGVVVTIAALTLPKRLAACDVPLWLALLPAIGLFSGALITFSAGIYPQPDPNHAGGAYGAGFIALPMFMVLSHWRVAGSGLRFYLAANMFAFFAIAVVMADVLPHAAAMPPGFVQKLLALTLFVPPAVAALALRPNLGTNGA